MIRRKQDDLAATIERLDRRVEELERELRRARQPSLPEAPGWGDEENVPGDPPRAVSHTWLSILDPPVRRRPKLPRLPFEILFVAACAVAAGFADLEPLWIAAVMAAAWLLVSLTEWSATLADRRRLEESALAPPRAVPLAAEMPDPSWYVPPVERTIVQGAGADSATAITTLRPAEANGDLDRTVERRAGDTT